MDILPFDFYYGASVIFKQLKSVITSAEFFDLKEETMGNNFGVNS